jgi:hypothetical protein
MGLMIVAAVGTSHGGSRARSGRVIAGSRDVTLTGSSRVAGVTATSSRVGDVESTQERVGGVE